MRFPGRSTTIGARRHRDGVCTTVIAAFLVAGTVACSSGSEDHEVEQAQPESLQPESSQAGPSRASPDRSVRTKSANGTSITIRIGDQTATATVWDTPAGADILGMLPLTLTLADHNNVEKTGPLPNELSMESMPGGEDPDIGDVGYYAPAGDFVLYYGDAPYYAGIARIGHIDSGVELIAQQRGAFTATLETAE